jgi:ribosome modulation factor
MAHSSTYAMQAGREAFSAGKTLEDCPYTNPDQAAEWRKGMKQAARDAIATSLGRVIAVRRMPKH